MLFVRMGQGAITSVILAAMEPGGMGPDYFENKTRHILPAGDKPLISHLIDTLDNSGKIGDKYIIIEERIIDFERKMTCESSYKQLFNKRINRDIYLFGQDPLTRLGTFEAVRSFVDRKDGEDIFPLLVCYGDTLIDNNFLNRVIDRYFEIDSDKPKLVWGLTKPKTENYLIKVEDL